MKYKEYSNQSESEKQINNCKVSETIKNMLIDQIKHELYNHNLYLTFANFYGVQGLIVLEEYYIRRAAEEKKHHDWIYRYLGTNDVMFSYPQIDQISDEFSELIDPIKITVDVENETTALIYKIVEQALEEKDWATYNWLMDNNDETGMLVKEQIEEMSISRTVLDIAGEDCSWLTKQKAIMNAYTNDVD